MPIKYIMRKLILGLFILFVSTGVYAGCVKDLDKNVERIMQEGFAKYHLTGMQLSIICKNETIPHDFVTGTTTISGKQPVTTTTLFQVGSITKSFTSALMLTLEADGLLSIDDAIGLWLPQLPEIWKKITIKQLLNQSSGIQDYSWVKEFQDEEFRSGGQRQWQPEELLMFVRDAPLLFTPGESFYYSNSNYVLAGMIIDAVLASSGKTYTDAVTARLLLPLHLFNTYYLPHKYSDDIFARMAHGYFFYDENVPLLDVTQYNMSLANTAGANVANAHDVALWLHGLMHGIVLAPQQMDEMMTAVPTASNPDAVRYGLALENQASADFSYEETWSHGGQTLGYSSQMIWFKCRDLVMSYTNNNSASDRSDYYGVFMIAKNIFAYIRQTDPDKQCVVAANRVPSRKQAARFPLRPDFNYKAK